MNALPVGERLIVTVWALTKRAARPPRRTAIRFRLQHTALARSFYKISILCLQLVLRFEHELISKRLPENGSEVIQYQHDAAINGLHALLLCVLTDCMRQHALRLQPAHEVC